MCGINGILTLQPSRSALQLTPTLSAMNTAIAHRGPDGDGSFVDDAAGIALGHRRLAILDLSPSGHQPMFNEDEQLVLVFNGEIYNYLELIPELQQRGHVFRSRTDSEVILHAYEEWGPRCVERFNGMWAFVLWDRRTRRLFASRDRFGVKPFVYTLQRDQLLFSSEIAGLRAATPLHRAHLGKLHDYLAYGYRTNNGDTFFEGVHELPPAHNLVVEDGQLQISRYWDLPAPGRPMHRDPREAAHALRELLADAVGLRFRSDVPVALLQSGGLDSSAICAVVNDEIEAGRLGVPSVTGYTAVHPGHAFDESAAVRDLMATCPHVRSVEIEPPGGVLAEQLPRFVQAMQEPMFSATSFAHWSLMQAIKAQGIKVVLNGQGADEALAGYGGLIVGYRLLDLLQTQPWRVPGEAAAMHRRMGFGYPYLGAQMAKAMLGRRAASVWRGRFSEGGLSVLDSAFHQQHADYLIGRRMRLNGTNLDGHLRAQLKHYGFNQILNYEDQSSMSQSIEIRSPFIDYRMMELAFSMSDACRFDGGITKRALREAFATRLPGSIVNQHRKIGFATPIDRWFTTPAFQGFIADLVSTSSFRSRSLWQGRELAQRLQDPTSASHGFPMWRFIMAELWMREAGIENG